MPGTWARIKTWAAGETLTAADLNAEFDNVINNADQDGIDDASANATAMQAMADPYPGEVISLPTNGRGEIQRLRYQIDSIIGKAQYYFDADTNLVLEFNKGADIASANAFPPGTDGNYFDVTGTTAITSIDTRRVGSIIRLHFDAILTLTHQATDLILPGAANITTAAGDEATFIEYATGDWRCIQYQRADGFSVAEGSTSIRDISRGLVIIRPSAATIDVDADEIILQTTTGRAFRASSVNLTANIGSSGANGLDTPSEASDTWYYIWVIYNSATSTTASLLSASSTAPTMPSGYTFKALVGAVRNDGSSDFIDFKQVGNESLFLDLQSVFTSATANAWTTTGSLAAFLPTTAKRIIAYMTSIDGIAGLSPESSGKRGHYASQGGTANSTFGGLFLTSENTHTRLESDYADPSYYYVGDTAADFYIQGFKV